MIIDSTVKDRKKYDEYLDRVLPIVETHGGRYHVRGETIRALGTWQPERIIVIEFPSEDAIHSWLASPEYAVIAALREQSADVQAILVEGYKAG
jgi:uncharacterized protein (DUF1330 family)